MRSTNINIQVLNSIITVKGQYQTRGDIMDKMGHLYGTVFKEYIHQGLVSRCFADRIDKKYYFGKSHWISSVFECC